MDTYNADAHHATVVVAKEWRPDWLGWLLPDGLVIHVTVTARTVFGQCFSVFCYVPCVSMSPIALRRGDRAVMSCTLFAFMMLGLASMAFSAASGVHVTAHYPEASHITLGIALGALAVAVLALSAMLTLPRLVLAQPTVSSSWSVLRRMALAMVFVGIAAGVAFGTIAALADSARLVWWQWVLSVAAVVGSVVGYLVTARSIRVLHSADRRSPGPNETVMPVRFVEHSSVATGKSGTVFWWAAVQYTDPEGRVRFATVIVDGWVKSLETGRAWVVFEQRRADRPSRLLLRPGEQPPSPRRQERQRGPDGVGRR